MRKLYDKNEMNFALVWIGIYVVSLMVADSISGELGIIKSVTAPVCIVMTGILYFWIRKNGLKEKYGLCRLQGSAGAYLYFIPLFLLASTNLWAGVKMNLTFMESLLFVISMLCVGFLEEVIFRGFLFKALCKDNVKSAIIISSVTFGFGHIVSLLSGQEIVATLLQICYACAVGFLFTVIFYKGKTLWPCIITHSVINSLSGFANESAGGEYMGFIGSAFLIVVSLVYAACIWKKTEKDNVFQQNVDKK